MYIHIHIYICIYIYIHYMYILGLLSTATVRRGEDGEAFTPRTARARIRWNGITPVRPGSQVLPGPSWDPLMILPKMVVDGVRAPLAPLSYMYIHRIIGVIYEVGIKKWGCKCQFLNSS